MIFLAAAIVIVGCVGAGAWLVTEGHPWFGAFAMLIGACIHARHATDTGDGTQYGIKDEAEVWQQKPDGVAVSGTKAEMLATIEAHQPHSADWKVKPLPTE